MVTSFLNEAVQVAETFGKFCRADLDEINAFKRLRFLQLVLGKSRIYTKYRTRQRAYSKAQIADNAEKVEKITVYCKKILSGLNSICSLPSFNDQHPVYRILSPLTALLQLQSRQAKSNTPKRNPLGSSMYLYLSEDLDFAQMGELNYEKYKEKSSSEDSEAIGEVFDQLREAEKRLEETWLLTKSQVPSTRKPSKPKNNKNNTNDASVAGNSGKKNEKSNNSDPNYNYWTSKGKK
jgi:hypothetical protein